MRSILEQPGAPRAAEQSRGHQPQSHPEPQGLVLNPRAGRGQDQHVLHAWYFLRICCYCTEQSPARQGCRADGHPLSWQKVNDLKFSANELPLANSSSASRYFSLSRELFTVFFSDTEWLLVFQQRDKKDVWEKMMQLSLIRNQIRPNPF